MSLSVAHLFLARAAVGSTDLTVRLTAAGRRASLAGLVPPSLARSLLQPSHEAPNPFSLPAAAQPYGRTTPAAAVPPALPSQASSHAPTSTASRSCRGGRARGSTRAMRSRRTSVRNGFVQPAGRRVRLACIYAWRDRADRYTFLLGEASSQTSLTLQSNGSTTRLRARPTGQSASLSRLRRSSASIGGLPAGRVRVCPPLPFLLVLSFSGFCLCLRANSGSHPSECR